MKADRDTSNCETPGRSADELARATRYRTIRDSALVLVHGAARTAGVETPRGLVSVAPGDGVRIYEGNVPVAAFAGVGPALLDLVLAHRGVDPRYRESVLLLRLDPRPLPPCGGRGRPTRDPGLRNRSEIIRLLYPIAERLPPGSFREELKLGIVLSRDAEILSATIVDSRTAATVTGEVMDLVRRMRFRPREIDGVPQDAMIYLPIRMEPREIPDPRMPQGTRQ